MAQGNIKSKPKAPTAGSGKRPSVLGPKKGARTIAPRRQSLVKNASMTKKHSAGLIAMTERTLGAKAGHLELLAGGKRNSKKAAKAGSKGKGGGKEVELKKGGSKKFG